MNEVQMYNVLSFIFSQIEEAQHVLYQLRFARRVGESTRRAAQAASLILDEAAQEAVLAMNLILLPEELEDGGGS